MASVTFSKSQKAVLDSGFLDTIGNKSDGVKLDRTAQALVDLTSVLLVNYEKNMNTAGSVSSGNLISDAEQVVSSVGKSITVDIRLLPYYKFRDQGVNGTSGDRGSKYSFRFKNPSRKMVKAVGEWANREGISVANDKYEAISAQDRKRKSFRGNQISAYALAQSIIRKGVKGDKSFTNAVETLNKELSGNKFLQAFKIDVTESI